jgi:hypothetical protein
MKKMNNYLFLVAWVKDCEFDIHSTGVNSADELISAGPGVKALELKAKTPDLALIAGQAYAYTSGYKVNNSFSALYEWKEDRWVLVETV